MEALYLDSKGLCIAWHYPSIDGLNGLRPTLRVGALHLNPRPPKAFGALAPTASFRGGALCFARFRPKNMAHHIFSPETETSKYPEAALETSPSFSVSEKLARYGSSALSGVEHLTCWQRVRRSRPDSSRISVIAETEDARSKLPVNLE